jgi:hypothetical protein
MTERESVRRCEREEEEGEERAGGPSSSTETDRPRNNTESQLARHTEKSTDRQLRREQG